MKIESILVTAIKTVTLTMSICLMTNLSASAANIIFCDTDEEPYNAVETLSYFPDKADKVYEDDSSVILSYVVNDNNKFTSNSSVSVTNTQNSQDVPEPLTILGTGVAFGLGSIVKKRNSSTRLNFGDD